MITVHILLVRAGCTCVFANVAVSDKKNAVSDKKDWCIVVLSYIHVINKRACACASINQPTERTE